MVNFNGIFNPFMWNMPILADEALQEEIEESAGENMELEGLNQDELVNFDAPNAGGNDDVEIFFENNIDIPLAGANDGFAWLAD